MSRILGSAEKRPLVESLDARLYWVIKPAVSRVGVSRVGGGVTFEFHCQHVIISLGVVIVPDNVRLLTVRDIRAGLVLDRLMEVRYPRDFERFTSDDWDQWSADVNAEGHAWADDSAKWKPITVRVDEGYLDGVVTLVEDRYRAAVFTGEGVVVTLAVFQLEGSRQSVLPEEVELRTMTSEDLEGVDW